MNELSTAKQAQIISAICEGMSIRGTARMTGTSKNSVTKLILAAGRAVSYYQDRTFRELHCERIECDEIWAFVHTKQANLHGDSDIDHGSIWTWIAIDPVSKLVPTWLVGQRDTHDCFDFIGDLESRLANRIQLSTDGLKMYAIAVDDVFKGNVDYAVVHKLFGKGGDDEHRYSPPKCTGVEKHVITGYPNMRKATTSIVERGNLGLRMSSRRYTRLTNAFSKRVENHAAATALHFGFYNLCRAHGTLTKRHGAPTTPAMAAGVEDRVWTATELVELLDRYAA